MPALLPALAALLSVLVALSDLYARRVPNAWLLGALLVGAPGNAVAWIQGAPLWPPLAGVALGLIVLLPFYVIKWMGAGDIKFFATLGFLLGSGALLPIWIIGSLLCGLHAVAILLHRHQRLYALPIWTMAIARMSHSALGQRIAVARQGRQGLPYAAYLAFGALFTIFHPALMHSW
ncbi:A24 family peptidase [Dyella sp. 20L07]|uniref:A24 family peptidase n=1 Tax=Dyella sp. 20L07 TaxID=3384240 RepID=UPI003D26C3B7